MPAKNVEGRTPMFSKGTKAQLLHQQTPVSHELQRHHEEVMAEKDERRELGVYLDGSSEEDETVH